MNNILPEACWAIVLLFFLAYLMLDGYDLGVGMLQFFMKSATRRNELVQKILPFWNGNEVWLLVSGGALFAFFPQAYATICSSLYIPINLLLFSLIIRAISFAAIHEFPGHLCSFLLGLSSFSASFMLGVLLGNLIFGIKLNENFEYVGKTADLFHSPALLFGLILASLFTVYAWVLTKKTFLVLSAGAIVLLYRFGIPSSIAFSPEGNQTHITVRDVIASNMACAISCGYVVCSLPLIIGSIIFVHTVLRIRPTTKNVRL
jgi:cytochrome bd-type quinol oxidase subunit 2